MQRAVFEERLCTEEASHRGEAVMGDLTPGHVPPGAVDAAKAVLQAVMNAASNHFRVSEGGERNARAAAVEDFALFHAGACPVVDLDPVPLDVVDTHSLQERGRLARDIDPSEQSAFDRASHDLGLGTVADSDPDFTTPHRDLVECDHAVRATELDAGLALLDGVVCEVLPGAATNSLPDHLLPQLVLLRVLWPRLELLEPSERLKELLLPLLLFRGVVVSQGAALLNLRDFRVGVLWCRVAALKLETSHTAPFGGGEHGPADLADHGGILEVLLLPEFCLQVENCLQEAVSHREQFPGLLRRVSLVVGRASFQHLLGELPCRGTSVAEQDECHGGLLGWFWELSVGLGVRSWGVTLDTHILTVHHQGLGVAPSLHHHLSTTTHRPVRRHDSAELLRHVSNGGSVVLLSLRDPIHRARATRIIESSSFEWPIFVGRLL